LAIYILHGSILQSKLMFETFYNW